MSGFKLRLWHRRLGLLSALVLCWLALTGLLLNHSDDLSLAYKKINHPLFNALYGLSKSRVDIYAFHHADDFYYCARGRLFKNTTSISSCGGLLQGALVFQGKIILLGDAELFILNQQSELLDQISLTIFAQKPLGILLIEDEVLLLDQLGVNKIDMVSLRLSEFALVESPGIELEKTREQLQVLPEDFLLEHEFYGIDVERILLDAHSGRLFGRWGVWIIDFFALSFFVLALSGLVIYFKRK